MRKLQITEGEAICYRKTSRHNIESVLIRDAETGVVHTEIKGFNCDKDAKLIADAFNTANKCDMLPSELLEQRDELLLSLKDLVWLVDNHALDEELRESVNLRAKAILNKIKNDTPQP